MQRYGGNIIQKKLGISEIDIVVYCGGTPTPSEDVCPVASGESEECVLADGNSCKCLGCGVEILLKRYILRVMDGYYFMKLK